MRRWIVPICIFLSLLLCTSGLGAKFIDASGKEVANINLGTDEVTTLAEGLAPIYTEDLIKSYGPVPEFDAEHHLKSSALASSFTNEKIWDDKNAKMDQLYELTKKKIDTKYGYPRGPVISYGTDVFGSVLVGILEGKTVDNKTYDQIYSIIQSNAKQIGIDNPPVIFFYSPMPKVDLGVTDTWRPVIGGIQGSNNKGKFTIGFAATRSGKNGFVTTGHTNAVGTLVYQPIPGQSTGKVTKNSECANSDSSFVEYNNVAAKIFRSSTSQPSVYSYGDPYKGMAVRKSGASTGYTAGPIYSQTSLYNPYYLKTLFNQWYADYSYAEGDSGAPVYWVNAASGKVYLVGQHWGSGRYACFSPISVR